MSTHQLRARFDARTITVYQAYSPAIADAALRAQAFVAPFSFERMTWIKPSFLWMMHRSGWATKPNQERILAVALWRDAFEEALACGVLTHPHPSLYPDAGSWRAQLERSPVRIQWDPDYDIRGGKLERRALQVGIGRACAQAYASEWIASIQDVTPLAKKIAALRRKPGAAHAARHLPGERGYPLPEALAHHIMASFGA